MNKNILRGVCIFCFLIFFFLLNPKINYAYVYTINYSCNNNLCVVGEEMTWIVSLDNKGDRDLKVSEIYIKGALSNNIVANISYGYSATDSEKSDNYLRVPINNYATIYLYGKVPKQNQQDSYFLYNFCLANALDAIDTYYTGSYTLPFCYTKNESIKVYECITNKDCKLESECIKNKCSALVCGKCQFASNNTCLNYSCCDSISCGEDEYCKNHFCWELPCENNQTAIHHSCVDLECGEGEYAVNHSCANANCNDEQYFYNDSCVDLECGEGEYAVNHSCVKLNCRDDYYASNGTCLKVVCLFNETAKNHSCIALECGFFQKTSNNQCVKDNSFLFRFALELSLIIVILFLMDIDVLRYKRKGDKILSNVNKGVK